jgi:hypothetical protein
LLNVQTIFPFKVSAVKLARQDAVVKDTFHSILTTITTEIV